MEDTRLPDADPGPAGLHADEPSPDRSRRRRPPIAVVLALGLGIPLVGLLLVTAASFVPDRLVLDELSEAIDEREIIDLQKGVALSGRGVDYFSDCIALTMGLGETDASSLTVGVHSPTFGSCPGTIESIVRYRDGGGLVGGYEYFRYWHGYTVVSRPLVAVVGVAAMRIVIFWTLVASLALLARRLATHHGVVAAGALLVPFLVTTDTIELPRSVPHGVAAIVGTLGAWALHRTASGDGLGPSGRLDDRDEPVGEARRDRLGAVAVVATIVGSAYVFVDVLTTPPGWLALGVIAAMLGAGAVDPPRRAVIGLVTAVAWLAGWAWTWVSKWVIAAVVMGVDRVRDDIGDAVDDRIAGERDYIDLAPFRSIERAVDEWLDHPLTWPVIAAIAVVGVLAWTARRRRAVDHRWVDRLVLAAPAVLPLIWYEVLRNHTQVHVGITYRSLGVCAGIVALALVVPILPAVDRRERRADAPATSTASAARQ